MDYLHLKVVHSIVDQKSKITNILEGDDGSKKVEIFYELDRVIAWSEDKLLDGNVLASLLYACRLGKNLRVHGAVSRKMLRNLKELQLIWRRWRPEIYQKIDIIPDRIVDSEKREGEGKAISAFSGGVDAVFTALSHTRLRSSDTRYPLKAGLMIHGFDVDLYNANGFEKLKNRVKPILDELGLELWTVRTNSRDLKLQDWNDSHGLELAACLHLLSGEFEFGLLGSSDPYDKLVLPWGSTPISDHLMGGGDFTVVHDGSGFSRTEKVEAISHNKVLCTYLKVCWAGSDQSQNCGKCEKCVRTKLNFMAAGFSGNVPCFPNEFDIRSIDAINIESDSQLVEMTGIIDYAQAHHVSGEWLDVLKKKIESWQPTSQEILARQKHGGLVKNTVVKIITGLGFDELAKKIWRPMRRSLFR